MSAAESVPAAEPEVKKITLLFIGIDYETGADGKASYLYKEVTGDPKSPDATLGKVVSFGKRLNYGMPGTVFTINQPEPGKVSLETDKFLCQWPDEDQRVHWQATSRANEQAHAEAKAAKELMKENAALERLKPFRQAYASASTTARRQMLAEILRYITSGRAE